MNQAKENRRQGRNYKGDEPSRFLNRLPDSTFYSSLAKKVTQSGAELEHVIPPAVRAVD